MKALVVLLLVALPCLTLAWVNLMAIMAMILIHLSCYQGVREKVKVAESCDLSDGDKQDCGVMGTTQVVIIVILIILVVILVAIVIIIT